MYETTLDASFFQSSVYIMITTESLPEVIQIFNT